MIKQNELKYKVLEEQYQQQQQQNLDRNKFINPFGNNTSFRPMPYR